MERPAAMSSEDFTIINSPDDRPGDRPPRQPSGGEASSPKSRMGTIYVEAQVKPDYTGSLSTLTTELECVFRSQSVHAVELGREMIGDYLYEECLFPGCLQSLKAVDLVGADDDYPFILIEGHRIEINSYALQDRKAIEILEDLSVCGEAIPLPSSEFDNAWERLIFEDEIKQKLAVFMTNLLRFSCKPGRRSLSSSSTVNRLVLLSGPPGTGKTSLSIGLSQKLAIRLNKTFGNAILLQLNSATLLSQYFGQSAAKIHSIFEALAVQLAETPKTLTVLLIDEIESLAASRETANARNEVHDAVRATNALLTGFDMVRNKANVLIMCTSNLSESLDAAFIDRCARHIKVPQPAIASRYEILRNSITGLVEREVLEAPLVPLPSFRQAEYRDPTDLKITGCALRNLAHRLGDSSPNGQAVSARWLSQLAEIALASELEPNALCTVDDAVNLMSRYFEGACGQQVPKRRQDTIATECDNPIARRSIFQLSARSSNLQINSHMFGEVCSSDLESTADESIAIFGKIETEKHYKPSPEDIDIIEERVIDRWERNGGCCCSKVICSRLRDYIEHGTPMDRGDTY